MSCAGLQIGLRRIKAGLIFSPSFTQNLALSIWSCGSGVKTLGQSSRSLAKSFHTGLWGTFASVVLKLVSEEVCIYLKGMRWKVMGWILRNGFSAATCAESWARRGSRGCQDATRMFELLDLRSS